MRGVTVEVMDGREVARDFDAGEASSAEHARRIVEARGWPVISVRTLRNVYVVRVRAAKGTKRATGMDRALRGLFGKW
jgi:hypothetical protein